MVRLTKRFFSFTHYTLSHNYNTKDASFPIQHGLIEPEKNPLGDRAALYDEFITGCREYYGKKAHACDETERDRLAMSLRQPQSMVNYTDTGFKKIRAPEQLRKLLTEYWETNKDKKKQEVWSTGNTYTNHWAAPTYMVSVEDAGLRGGGGALKHKLWNAAQSTIEQWTGVELQPTSMYGIRVYTEGAILSPHVDRMPLVSSAIINVAQDVDEPWPLEVYDRQGNAVNVTMEPGDMVLYESHSLVHGRVFPLKGRYYANIFIHFEPTGHSLRHGMDDDAVDVNKQYRDAMDDNKLYNSNTKLPPYIVENSLESKRWLRTHSKAWESPSAAATPASDAHHAAMVGDMESLRDIAATKKHLLRQKDRNGWEPIHEASRGGNKDAIELLVKHGANVNERTNHGVGGSPLYWAKKSNGDDHEAVDYLLSVGAEMIHPEL